MIRGKIETFEVVGGGRLHRGHCTVTNETVSAGQVVSQQLDEPAPGMERVTLYWRNERHNGTSTCEFEVLDRRPT